MCQDAHRTAPVGERPCQAGTTSTMPTSDRVSRPTRTSRALAGGSGLVACHPGARAALCCPHCHRTTTSPGGDPGATTGAAMPRNMSVCVTPHPRQPVQHHTIRHRQRPRRLPRPPHRLGRRVAVVAVGHRLSAARVTEGSSAHAEHRPARWPPETFSLCAGSSCPQRAQTATSRHPWPRTR